MNLFRNIILLAVAMGLVSACGDALFNDILNINERDHNGHLASNASKAPACQFDGQIDESRILQEDEITLKRHSQRVIRYGCDADNQPTRDVVVSDKWEEVEKPRTSYFIYPKDENLPSGNNIKVRAYNKTTCSSDSEGEELIKFLLTAGLLNLLEKAIDDRAHRTPYIKLDLDLANHAFDMRVNEGVNHIDYEFSEKCEGTENGCNEGVKKLEEGTMLLKVNYDLKEKGVIKEIKHVDNKCPEKSE